MTLANHNMISVSKYNVFISQKNAFFRKKTAIFNGFAAKITRKSLTVNDLAQKTHGMFQVGINGKTQKNDRKTQTSCFYKKFTRKRNEKFRKFTIRTFLNVTEKDQKFIFVKNK